MVVPPSLHHWVDEIKHSARFNAKRALKLVPQKPYIKECHDALALPGDDCAAFSSNGEYILHAAEGMDTQFLVDQPWLTGWSSVMVNASDVAAMGGRLETLTATLWHSDSEQATDVLNGINAACNVFDVSLCGGHTDIRESHTPCLSVSVTGRASTLLSVRRMIPGMSLHLLTLKQGTHDQATGYWNCVAGLSHETIQAYWQCLPALAEQQSVAAAKDISNAGMLGTLLMMLEVNGLGAECKLDDVKPPEGVTMQQWLTCFHAFGFILACAPESVPSLKQALRGFPFDLIEFATTTESGEVFLHHHKDTVRLWHFGEQGYTGLSHGSAGNA